MRIYPKFTNPYPSAQPVTVQSGYYNTDEFVVDWCDHAGAELEEVTNHAGLESEYYEQVYFCDKCGAWLSEVDDGQDWQDPTSISRDYSDRERKAFVKAGGKIYE